MNEYPGVPRFFSPGFSVLRCCGWWSKLNVLGMAHFTSCMRWVHLRVPQIGIVPIYYY